MVAVKCHAVTALVMAAWGSECIIQVVCGAEEKERSHVDYVTVQVQENKILIVITPQQSCYPVIYQTGICIK